jgi:hypothetical protein
LLLLWLPLSVVVVVETSPSLSVAPPPLWELVLVAVLVVFGQRMRACGKAGRGGEGKETGCCCSIAGAAA